MYDNLSGPSGGPALRGPARRLMATALLDRDAATGSARCSRPRGVRTVRADGRSRCGGERQPARGLALDLDDLRRRRPPRHARRAGAGVGVVRGSRGRPAGADQAVGVLHGDGPGLAAASLSQRLLAGLILVDAPWALARARETGRRRFYLGAGLTLFVAWPAMVTVGALTEDVVTGVAVQRARAGARDRLHRRRPAAAAARARGRGGGVACPPSSRRPLSAGVALISAAVAGTVGGLLAEQRGPVAAPVPGRWRHDCRCSPWPSWAGQPAAPRPPAPGRGPDPRPAHRPRGSCGDRRARRHDGAHGRAAPRRLAHGCLRHRAGPRRPGRRLRAVAGLPRSLAAVRDVRRPRVVRHSSRRSSRPPDLKETAMTIAWQLTPPTRGAADSISTSPSGSPAAAPSSSGRCAAARPTR